MRSLALVGLLALLHLSAARHHNGESQELPDGDEFDRQSRNFDYGSDYGDVGYVIGKLRALFGSRDSYNFDRNSFDGYNSAKFHRRGHPGMPESEPEGETVKMCMLQMRHMKHKSVEMFGCFGTIHPSMNVARNATRCCINAIEDALDTIENGEDFGNEEAITMLNDMRECKFDSLGLIGSDGKFDRDALEAMAELEGWKSMGETEKFQSLQDIYQNCIDLVDDSAEFEEQALQLDNCLMDNMIEECNQNYPEEGAGMLPFFKALNRLDEESACADVEMPSEFESQMESCVDEVKSKYKGKRRRKKGRRPSRRKAGGSLRKRHYGMYEPMPEEESMHPGMHLEIMKCFAEQNGFYNEEEGILFQDLADYVDGLDGWQNEQRDIVVSAVLDCSEGLDLETLEEDEVWEDYPQIGQVKLFKKCFMPVFVNTCGVNNNIVEAFIGDKTEMLMRKILKGMKMMDRTLDQIEEAMEPGALVEYHMEMKKKMFNHMGDNGRTKYRRQRNSKR